MCMSVTKAYCCPKTSKLFHYNDDGKKDYIVHLKKLAAKNLRARVVTKNKQVLSALLDAARASCDSIAAIEAFISKNIAYIAYLQNKINFEVYKQAKKVPAIVVFTNTRYSITCSNSHSFPRGGVSNFSHNSNKPTGYAGFNARLKCSVYGSWPDKITVSDIVKHIGVSTGTGGGRHSCAFDATIWLDNWPALKAVVEEQQADYDHRYALALDKNKRANVERILSGGRSFGLGWAPFTPKLPKTNEIAEHIAAVANQLDVRIIPINGSAKTYRHGRYEWIVYKDKHVVNKYHFCRISSNLDPKEIVTSENRTLVYSGSDSKYVISRNNMDLYSAAVVDIINRSGFENYKSIKWEVNGHKKIQAAF